MALYRGGYRPEGDVNFEDIELPTGGSCIQDESSQNRTVKLQANRIKKITIEYYR